jgi:hypothetical protein
MSLAGVLGLFITYAISDFAFEPQVCESVSNSGSWISFQKYPGYGNDSLNLLTFGYPQVNRRCEIAILVES